MFNFEFIDFNKNVILWNIIWLNTNLNRIQKLKDEEILTSTVQRVVRTGWLAGVSKIVLGLIVSDKLVVVVAETEK